MSEARFTPGPWKRHGKGWRWDHTNGGEFVPLLGANGEWIADVRRRLDLPALESTPDMYAACEAALPLVLLIEERGGTPQLRQQARETANKIADALAAARGEQ